MSTELGAAVIRFQADTSALESGFARVGKLMGGLPVIAAGATAAVAGIGIAAVKAAGNFQQSMTQLVTGAGESQSNLKMVSDGILKMAVDTGTGTKQLADAMFLVESSNYRGAQGLQVLQTAAEGAKVGNADLTQTTDILTTSLHDYTLGANMAVPVMNSLIVAVQNGKMTMDVLNQSLTNVLPLADTFHIKLSDVEGALNKMAMSGDKGASAGTHLAMMFKMLENPSSTAQKAMTAMGINSINLAQTMSTSLPNAMQMIENAVAQHFVPGSIQYNRAIAAILGGSKSGTAGLELMSGGLKDLQLDTTAAAAALNTGGSAVSNWALVQQDFNQQMDRAKETLETFGIKIGTAIIPYVQQFIGFLTDKGLPVLTNLSDWITKTALPAFTLFSKWFVNEAIPYAEGLANTVGRNLLPPLESLIGNVMGISEGIGNWLVQSGLLSNAVDGLSGLLGTLVGWVSDLVAGMRDGNPLVSTLAGAFTALGTSIALVKIEQFGLGLYNSFQQMRQGAGFVTNLAAQVFPDLTRAISGTAVAVEGVGTAATEAEAVTGTAAAGMTAAMGIATAGISVLLGALVALWMATQNDITVGTQKMSTATQKAYDAMGNSAADNAAKAKAAQIAGANDTTNELMNQGSRASAAWAGSYDKQVIAADNAKAKMILDQQKIADEAEAAAQRADAAWVQASQQMSLTALLASAGWTGPQIAAYTGQGQNTFQGGPAPRGAHASGILNSPFGHWATVGERGPETMFVPQGSSIFPSGSGVSALAMAGALGGGKIENHTHVYLDSTEIAHVVGSNMDQIVRAKFGPRARM